MTTEEIRTYYQKQKNKYPDALFLFRDGDSYRMFSDDADAAAQVLGLTVYEEEDGTHFIEFPHFNLDTHLPRLIRSGYRIAIDDLDG